MSMTVYVDDRAAAPGEIELDVEEMEEVIAPKLSANHNETLVSDGSARVGAHAAKADPFAVHPNANHTRRKL